MFLFLASGKDPCLVGFIIKTDTEAAALVAIFADPEHHICNLESAGSMTDPRDLFIIPNEQQLMVQFMRIQIIQMCVDFIYEDNRSVKSFVDTKEQGKGSDTFLTRTQIASVHNKFLICRSWRVLDPALAGVRAVLQVKSGLRRVVARKCLVKSVD